MVMTMHFNEWWGQQETRFRHQHSREALYEAWIAGVVFGRAESAALTSDVAAGSDAEVIAEAIEALPLPNNRICEPCKVDHVPRDQKTR